MTDQILKRDAQNFDEASIGDADFTVERNGEDRVVQAVDQFAVIQLRAGNYFDELLELRFGGSAHGARRWLRRWLLPGRAFSGLWRRLGLGFVWTCGYPGAFSPGESHKAPFFPSILLTVRATEEKKDAAYAKLLNRPEGQGERVRVGMAREGNLKLAQLRLAATR